jgi:hypothetical protein
MVGTQQAGVLFGRPMMPRALTHPAPAGAAADAAGRRGRHDARQAARHDAQDARDRQDGG